ncbi:hypothetical protein AHAS_Ahas04G0115100 [Arachis hypogaea]
MANLANTMEANAAATLQAVQRLGQPARNGHGNKNGEGNANDNAEGNGDNTGGVLMTLAIFLKVHLPTFCRSTNLIEAATGSKPWSMLYRRNMFPTINMSSLPLIR